MYMKSKINQIKFLDMKLLPIYGFKSINDYETKISEDSLATDQDLLIKFYHK